MQELFGCKQLPIVEYAVGYLGCYLLLRSFRPTFPPFLMFTYFSQSVKTVTTDSYRTLVCIKDDYLKLGAFNVCNRVERKIYGDVTILEESKVCTRDSNVLTRTSIDDRAELVLVASCETDHVNCGRFTAALKAHPS